MLKTKFYLYNSENSQNGYRGEDFSNHILQGVSIKEDITQELDTAEVTLVGLTFGKALDPETKIIIDIVEQIDGNELILETKHFCVSRDMVEQPILSNSNYFNHHISLLEPSVIAQKRLVDNIATTYKLKDVSLTENVAYPTDKISFSLVSSFYTPPTYSTTQGTSNHFGVEYGYMKLPIGNIVANRGVIGKYFRQDGELKILNLNNEEFDDMYNDIDNFLTGNGSYRAKFKIPRIEIIKGLKGSSYWSNEDLFDEGQPPIDRMFASIDYLIQEFMPNDLQNQTNSWSGSFISNSNIGYDSVFVQSADFNVNFSNNFETEVLDGEWLLEDIQNTDGFFDFFYKKYTNKNAVEPTYITQEIEIKPNRRYVVTLSLHQFNDNLPTKYNDTRRYKYSGNTILKYLNVLFTTEEDENYNRIGTEFSSTIDIPENYPTKQRMTTQQSSAKGDVVIYDADEPQEIVYTSSTPYSALSLIQKAIINSSLYEKQDGVYIADVNNSNIPFYIAEKYADDPNGVSSVIEDLSTATIIENFYSQKNLWEILIEAGHYIHSIPEIRFGENDRFEITFNRLGRTDQKQSNSTSMSIFNSRSVEDYISSTSSYITNMVQLGGFIEEWVAPKTTDETLLVSNDTASIIVSKPIIELLEIRVKNIHSGLEADLTPFIYEENVYKTLQLDYQIEPNRGIAMYYKLGTNIITGGNYQLPQSNTNIYTDYAFKKIIYSAFSGYPVLTSNPASGYWTELNIQDYIFLVKYRTKDSVRQNHSRPDIRKYLLNSKFDKIPEHSQFNNQTDVVVDSIKFGNNMYGNLIKTGNNSYVINEWNTEIRNIKKKGDLYKINGELYYVAKVTNIYFSSYVISEISYSKDYNELSQVIGIPSEPRFYEISEQSIIRREFAINDMLMITDDDKNIRYGGNFVINSSHLADLILGESVEFAKYAITVFKGDKDAFSYSQTIGQPSFYKEIISPINAYSSENTLTYEWDMIDNYSAGDKVISVSDNKTNLDEKYYNSLRAVGYTDIYGKSALMDFYVLGNIGNLNYGQIKEFPECPISTKDNNDGRPFVGDYDILATNVDKYDENFNGRGLGLLKDCREALSINYNLQAITDSDTFVLSPYLYSPKKRRIKIVLLEEEINKLSSGYLDTAKIITPIDKNGNEMNPYFDFSPTKTPKTSEWDISKNITSSFSIDLSNIFSDVADGHFTGEIGYTRIKSIAIICDVSLNIGLENDPTSILDKTRFVLARNIPSDWSRDKALTTWFFGGVNKAEVFKNKQ